jgi:hypothetical protein
VAQVVNARAEAEKEAEREEEMVVGGARWTTKAGAAAHWTTVVVSALMS